MPDNAPFGPEDLSSEAPTLRHELPLSTDLYETINVEQPILPPQVAFRSSGSESFSGVNARIRYFGDYELICEIARGGMGVVYQARQVNLNRLVALKMILAGQLASEEDVKRFYTEAEAAAALDHPGIVPIFEIGEHNGQHFFSMGFVNGGSLSDRIKDGPLSSKDSAKYTKKIAEAIAYAHSKGVIHRDLKPANILLDHNSEPKVTDFGLARRTESNSDLTRTGAVMGTPSFMPPEQASGKTDEIGSLADVYSLGAILYCLLTGRPPFQASNPLDTLMQVLSQEPVAPRLLNPEVPKDLETICLKCLQKNANKRYGSAEELASDLGRYLNGEPILARPIGALERGVKWIRRNQTIAAAVAFVIASMLIAIIGISLFAIRAERSRIVSEERRYREQVASLGRAIENRSPMAPSLWENAKSIIMDRGEKKIPFELKCYKQLIEHSFLGNISVQRSWVFPDGDRALVQSLDGRFSIWDLNTVKKMKEPDAFNRTWIRYNINWFSLVTEDWLTQVTEDGIVLWDAKEIKPIHTIPIDTAKSYATSIAISDDGSKVASVLHDRDSNAINLLVWNCPTKTVLASIPSSETYSKLFFDKKGENLILVTELGREVKVLNLESAGELKLLGSVTNSSGKGVVMNTQGTRMAIAGLSSVAIWNMETWESISQPARKAYASDAEMQFHPNGYSLVRSSPGSEIGISHVDTGAIEREIEVNEGHPTAITINKNGQYLAWSNEKDHSIEVVEFSSGRKINRFLGHSDKVVKIAFSANGDHLVSASDDHTMRIWDIKSGNSIEVLALPRNQVKDLFFSSNDERLVVNFDDGGGIGVWRSPQADGQDALKVFSFFGSVPETRFISDGGLFLLPEDPIDPSTQTPVANTMLGDDKRLSPQDVNHSFGLNQRIQNERFTRMVIRCGSKCRLMNPITGSIIAILDGDRGAIQEVAMMNSGAMVATAMDDGAIQLWNGDNGSKLNALRGHTGIVQKICFSPDGRLLASKGADETVRIWDATTQKLLTTLETNDLYGAQLLFSPDGSRLATQKELFSVLSRKKIADLKCDLKKWSVTLRSFNMGTVASIRFSPDGQFLASKSNENYDVVILWDAWTGQPQQVFAGHDNDITCLDFSPDGTLLATGSDDKTIRLWDIKAGGEVGRLNVGAASVRGLTFRPDGELLACVTDRLTFWGQTDAEFAEAKRLALDEREKLVPVVASWFDSGDAESKLLSSEKSLSRLQFQQARILVMQEYANRRGNGNDFLVEFNTSLVTELRKIIANQGESIEVIRLLAAHLKRLATLERSSRSGSLYLEAISVIQPYVDKDPANLILRRDIAAIHQELAKKLSDADKERSYVSELQNYRVLAESKDAIPSDWSNLGNALNKIADAKVVSEPKESLARYQEAVSWQRKALAAKPNESQIQLSLIKHFQGVIRACKLLGEDQLESQAEKQLTELIGSNSSNSQIDDQIRTFVDTGTLPAQTAEILSVAKRLMDRELFAVYSQFVGKAIAADAKLDLARDNGLRYNAACYAVLASSDQRSDIAAQAKTSQVELRQNAFQWLQDELDFNREQSKSAQEINRVHRRMAHWKTDSDLIGIRDLSALESLPEEEQNRWKKLWEAVNQLEAETLATNKAK